MVFLRKALTQCLRLSNEMNQSAFLNPVLHENYVQEAVNLSKYFAVLPNSVHSYDHSRSPKDNSFTTMGAFGHSFRCELTSPGKH